MTGIVLSEKMRRKKQLTRRLAGPWQTDCMKPLIENCQAKFSVRLYYLNVGDPKLMFVWLLFGVGERVQAVGGRVQDNLVGGGESRQKQGEE